MRISHDEKVFLRGLGYSRSMPVSKGVRKDGKGEGEPTGQEQVAIRDIPFGFRILNDLGNSRRI